MKQDYYNMERNLSLLIEIIYCTKQKLPYFMNEYLGEYNKSYCLLSGAMSMFSFDV